MFANVPRCPVPSESTADDVIVTRPAQTSACASSRMRRAKPGAIAGSAA